MWFEKADQLTLFQPEGSDYAHKITTGTPGFSYGPAWSIFFNSSNSMISWDCQALIFYIDEMFKNIELFSFLDIRNEKGFYGCFK